MIFLFYFFFCSEKNTQRNQLESSRDNVHYNLFLANKYLFQLLIYPRNQCRLIQILMDRATLLLANHMERFPFSQCQNLLLKANTSFFAICKLFFCYHSISFLIAKILRLQNLKLSLGQERCSWVVSSSISEYGSRRLIKKTMQVKQGKNQRPKIPKAA